MDAAGTTHQRVSRVDITALYSGIPCYFECFLKSTGEHDKGIRLTGTPGTRATSNARQIRTEQAVADIQR